MKITGEDIGRKLRNYLDPKVLDAVQRDARFKENCEEAARNANAPSPPARKR